MGHEQHMREVQKYIQIFNWKIHRALELLGFCEHNNEPLDTVKGG
jgi:hypothetical protein